MYPGTRYLANAFSAVLLASWTPNLLAASDSKVALFRADPRHTGVYNTHAIKPGRLKWRFKTGGKVRSTPAVVEGIACFGSEDGHLYAIDISNGQSLWKFRTGGDVSSSPAVAEDTVYFLGGDGVFYAAGLKTGQQRWKFPAGPDLPFEAMKGDPRTWDYFLSSPTLMDDGVYFGSGDGNLYALDRKTGKLRWRFQTKGRVRTSPAIEGGVAYVGSFDHHLYAVDLPTGKLKWEFQAGAPIQSSPAVADGLVYFGARDAHLHAVDIQTGQEVWKADHQGSWVVASPAVAHGMVFAGSSDGQFVQAVDAKTGVEKWRFKTDGNVFSSLAVAEEALYFGAFNVRMYVLDTRRGKLQSLNVAESAINSSPVLADGVLYFGSDDNCLYAFEGEALHERPDLSLDPRVLEAYVGEYEVSPGLVIAITREGDHIMAQATGQTRIQLSAQSETEFYFNQAGLDIKFLKDEKAEVTGLKLAQGGQTFTAKKTK
jgi:outer membrane protein assembly factor BamB